MSKNIKYRLCGGTFFTLLSNARLPLLNKAENYKGKRSGHAEWELLWALTRVVRPDAPIKPTSREKSLVDATSDFKSCKSFGSFDFDLGNKSVRYAFDERIKTSYIQELHLMTEVVNKFIEIKSSAKKDEYLVKALVEVLGIDDTINPNQELFVCENGNPMKKSDILVAREICLQSFLLGIWHFCLMGVEDNTVGQETYNGWCPPKGRAPRNYIKTIGEDSQRKITLRYYEKTKMDDEVIEAEIIGDDTTATCREKVESDSVKPQQTVNNPFVFNFTQNGNNNTQIGHIENYYADKRGKP